MATIDSEDFGGMAADAALTTSRTLPGAGTRTWTNPGTGAFIRSNGSGVGFAYEDSARCFVDLGANKNYQATVDFNMSAACNIVVLGLKTDGAGGWNASIAALLVGLTDLRVREYDSGGTPTDRATKTIGALSTGTNYKLQLVRSGLVWTARVLTSGGALVDATAPYTAGSAPSGNFWGFGFLNSGTTATFDNFLVEDAPVAASGRRRAARF